MTEPAQSSPLPALLRDALGDSYTIEGEIGRGGMGVVYRARDERLHRRVAIKALPPELAFSSEIRERFTREAQTAARLSHPHIVPIHDVGEGSGVVYFVMGLIEGESLAARIRRRGRLPAEEVRRIMRETADALSAAHAVSVIHRDIKPDNILLEGQRGRVVVTDFGIAKAMSATGHATLTSAGMAIGTPSFMSPEQAAGEREIDGRSDLYSLGIVSYQMLSGELPFNAPTVAGILMKHITEAAPLLHEKFPDVPEDLSLAVARCLEKDPENRWPSADQLRRALESRNVAGYRPTGLGWRAADAGSAPTRPSPTRGAPTRPQPGARSPRPLTERPGNAARPPRPLSERPGTRSAGTRGAPDLRNNLPARPGQRAPVARRGLAGGLADKTDPAIPDTGEPKVVRVARAEFAKFAAVVGGCFMINIATGLDGPWFLFIAGGMSIGLFKKYSELWQAGYSWRDVLNRPDAPDAVASSPAKRIKGAKVIAPPTAEVFGPRLPRMLEIHGDRAAILSLWDRLGQADRDTVPEMIDTVESLYAKASDLGASLAALDTSLGASELARIDERIAEVSARPEGEERDRQLSLLQRQRQSCVDLVSRRDAIAERFESCALAMQNLRFDLMRLKQSGIGTVGENLTQATQAARALSRDVDNVIGAAAEVRNGG
ncbi:MAG TPA: protein kinase [Gemmatimonadales bacterium]|nr:protein kinase [Gemmatimonadales bacterium]